MNYYEHHIGDYAEATAHLSFVEDAAYSRLIRKYYAIEKPLPADVASVQRLIGARTKEEKKSVEVVLSEFFFLGDDGWHNSRCDEEIANYYAKKPAAEEKRENAKDRQRRARERRKAIFEELSSHGVHMPWNATTEHAQAELSRIKSQPVTQPVTRDDTANQTPVPSHQTPDLKTHTVHYSTEGTSAGHVCGRLKSEARMTDMNPANPKLLALLEAGLTADEIVAAGVEAKSKGKGFAYALAVAEGRRREAAAITPLPTVAARPATGRQAAIDNYAAQAAAARGEGIERPIANERDITGEAVRVA